jgi:hypothetical protein
MAQPVAADPAAEPATPVTHHHRRTVVPVEIKATTGEAGEAATGPPPDTTVTAQPVAPITVAPGADASTPATTGSAVRPPVAPVQLAPQAAAKPPVTPVKLGGKQPGQDEYDDPQ